MKSSRILAATVVAFIGLAWFLPAAQADAVGPFVWVPKAPVVFVNGAGVEGAATSVIGGKIYTSHGYSFGDTRKLRIYTIGTDSWVLGPDAAVVRSELGGATVGGKHYAIGGRPPAPGIGDVVEIFDPATNSWSFGASMPTPRAGLCVAVVGGKIHAIGGRSGSSPNSGTALAAHEIYDPGTNMWSPAAPLPTAVGDNYACTALQGKIYVFGGYDGIGISGLTQIYDAGTDSWSPGALMPTPRSNAIAGVLDCHPVVIGGASTLSGGNLSVVEIYHASSNSWTAGPPKPTPGSEFGASMPGSGSEIFAIGSGIFGPSSAVHEALAGGEAGCVCEPLTQGYWHRQCLGVSSVDGGIDPGRNGRGPQSPTEPGFFKDLMPAVGTELENTLNDFGGSCASGMDASPASDACERATKQYTALLFNLASGRLFDVCAVDLSAEGCASTDIGDLVGELANLINSGQCNQAAECAGAVNEGAALESLSVASTTETSTTPVTTTLSGSTLGGAGTVTRAVDVDTPTADAVEPYYTAGVRTVLETSAVKAAEKAPAVTDEDPLQAIERHLGILTDGSSLQEDLGASTDALLTALSGGYELETRLAVARGLLGRIDVSLHSLLAAHLEDIRSEAEAFDKLDLAQEAARLLKGLEPGK